MLREQVWTIIICLAIIGWTGLMVYRFLSPMLRG
jgi:hypothetical protein